MVVLGHSLLLLFIYFGWKVILIEEFGGKVS